MIAPRTEKTSNRYSSTVGYIITLILEIMRLPLMRAPPQWSGVHSVKADPLWQLFHPIDKTLGEGQAPSII